MSAPFTRFLAPGQQFDRAAHRARRCSASSKPTRTLLASRGWLVVGPLDCCKELSGWRCTRRAEDHPAIFADDHDGPRDAVQLALDHRPFGLERVIHVGYTQALIHKEVEGQVKVLDEALVALSASLIDAIRLSVKGAELGNRVTHGGKLIRSAARHIFRIKNQQCPLLTS